MRSSERWPERRSAARRSRPRARMTAATRRPPRAATPPAPRQPGAGRPDPVAFAVRHIELHREHEADLEPAVDRLEAEVAALWQRVNELIATVEERDRQLAEITTGGWWRLRERLLPLFRGAGAVRRRLRR